MEKVKPELEKIIKVIDRILEGDYDVQIEENLPGELGELSKKVNLLIKDLRSFYKGILNMGRGNFSFEIDGKKGIAAGIKTIQANFLHLLWQARRIAEGDFSQEIISLGEISEAINKMIRALKLARSTIEERTRELKEKDIEIQQLFISIVSGLSRIVESKNINIRKHSVNVANYAALLAKEVGLPENEVESIKTAGYLHDIGKIAVSEHVLRKPDTLSKEEYEQVKIHPSISTIILEPIKEFNSIISSIQYHHEKFDGTGYPSGLIGKEIPIGARILSIADAYDDLASERPYHRAYKREEILAKLIASKGSQFDPDLLDKFIELIREKRI
jgi:putative nucleotidyltransferase with HDIG domain